MEAPEDEAVENLCQKVFLATADHLPNHMMKVLISNMQIAATGVLKKKQLWDPFSIDELHETIIQLLESYMRSDSPKQWLTCLLPENTTEMPTNKKARSEFLYCEKASSTISISSRFSGDNGCQEALEGQKSRTIEALEDPSDIK
ncbi:hypothetical protein QJS10_CPA01g01428 [Acorus calamus]|uniref:Uncharacterized protein n=1 Tax=Acorus calamus TaxID=4465 RepID=A0AAV9FMH4_ACOCL|nr:hypothetical protein QJS10_CPA01g01428 [Acorus calamus]